MCMRRDSRRPHADAAKCARMFAWIVAHPWAYPALEVVHIVGIALLLGNLVLFELRVWGCGPRAAAGRAGAAGAACRAGRLRLMAASGLLMFAGQPAELLANRAFVIKMGLVLLAGLNAACSMPAAACSGWTAARARRPWCRWGFGWLSSSAAAGSPMSEESHHATPNTHRRRPGRAAGRTCPPWLEQFRPGPPDLAGRPRRQGGLAQPACRADAGAAGRPEAARRPGQPQAAGAVGRRRWRGAAEGRAAADAQGPGLGDRTGAADAHARPGRCPRSRSATTSACWASPSPAKRAMRCCAPNTCSSAGRSTACARARPERGVGGARAASVDDVIGLQQQRLRNHEAEGASRRQVDHELDSGWAVRRAGRRASRREGSDRSALQPAGRVLPLSCRRR